MTFRGMYLDEEDGAQIPPPVPVPLPPQPPPYLSEEPPMQPEQTLPMPAGPRRPIQEPISVVRGESESLAPGQIRITKLPDEQPKPAEKGFDWARGMAGLFEGSQGIANIDRGRNEKARLAMEQGREKRQAEMDKFQIDDKRRILAETQSLRDPMSPQSSRARHEMTVLLDIAGNQLFPNLKPQLDAMAGKLNDMSAFEMKDMMESKTGVGFLLNLARQTQHDKATQAMAEASLGVRKDQAAGMAADRAEGREIQRQTLAARLQELADKRAEREEKRNTQAEEKLGKQLAPINEMEAQVLQAKDAKTKVNTGKVSHALQAGLKWLGLANDDYLKLEALQGTIDNKITQLQSGQNVTANEAQRLRQQLAYLDQDDNEFDIKLAQMLDTLRLKASSVKEAHPRATRRVEAGAAPQPQAAQPAAPAQAAPQAAKPAPAGAPPGKVIQFKDGKKYRISADGKTMSEVV